MPRETLTDLPLDLLSLIPYWLLVIEVRHSSVNLCYQRIVLEAARASSRDVAQFGRVCKATHATLKSDSEPELKAHARALRREARARMRATRFVPSAHQGYVSDSVWAPPEKTVLTVPLFETQRERERQSVRTAEAFHNAMRYDVTTDAAHDVPGRIERFNIRKRTATCALRQQYADHPDAPRRTDQLCYGWDAQSNALHPASENWTGFDLPSADGRVVVSYDCFDPQDGGGGASETGRHDSLTVYERVVDEETGTSRRGDQLHHWRAEGDDVRIGWCCDTIKVSHCGDLVAFEVTDPEVTKRRIMVWDLVDGSLAQIVDSAHLRNEEDVEYNGLRTCSMEWIYQDGHGHGHGCASPVALLVGWSGDPEDNPHAGHWTMEAIKVRPHQDHQDHPSSRPLAPFATGDAWAALPAWNECVGSRLYEGVLLAMSASRSGRIAVTISEGFADGSPAMHIWRLDYDAHSYDEILYRFVAPPGAFFTGLAVSPCGTRIVCTEHLHAKMANRIRVWHSTFSAGSAYTDWSNRIVDVRDTMKTGTNVPPITLVTRSNNMLLRMSPCGRFVMVFNRAAGYDWDGQVGPNQRHFGGGAVTVDLFPADPSAWGDVVHASGPMYGHATWRYDVVWAQNELSTLESRGAFSVMVPVRKR
jgi:hypothetical protein